jgi:hypothetical protein
MAGALNSTPEEVLDAVERKGIEPMLDTAKPKGQGKDRDRPTDPGLRCLALTRENFGRLVEAAGFRSRCVRSGLFRGGRNGSGTRRREVAPRLSVWAGSARGAFEASPGLNGRNPETGDTGKKGKKCQ